MTTRRKIPPADTFQIPQELHAYPGTTATAIAQSDTTTKLAQVLPGNECVVVS
jgi:hypothetical protein